MTTSITSLVTGVDFITVPTRDFEQAGEFYGTLLGLRPSVRWGSMPAGEFETGTLTNARYARRPAAGASDGGA